MSETDGERPQIKVTDRRLFDRDGNPREPDAGADEGAGSEREKPAQPTPAGDIGAPGSRPASASEPEARPVEPTRPAQPTPEQPPAAAPANPNAAEPANPEATEGAELDVDDETLMRFLEEQYIGGLLALGAMPEPQSGQVSEDLDLAKLRIELLALLQERTEGTRGPEASKAFEDVLYQLRMVYLQKRKVVEL